MVSLGSMASIRLSSGRASSRRAKPPARSSERSYHPTRDPKPLGKIFGDLIERVRFARTLRRREMDSNLQYRGTRARDFRRTRVDNSCHEIAGGTDGSRTG
jgi:hypothetical protein